MIFKCSFDQEGQQSLQEALQKERQETQAGPERLQEAGRMELGDVPWEQDKQDFPKITAEDLKASSELGKDGEQTAQSLVEDNLQNAEGDEVFENLGKDIQALTEATGLGDLFQAKSQAAVQNVAEDLLFEGVRAKEVEENPALGKMLATLQNSENPALKGALEGKKGPLPHSRRGSEALPAG